MREPIPEWAQDIRERIVRIETMVTDSASTRDKADRADELSRANDKRLDRIEESHTWLWRTVVGAIIASAIGWFVSLAPHI
ncbi:hemolysin XhlA family protein [Alicyclobacillus fastidiosus]|uniref:Hemolysin XhlA family protein n=1 Tax=Alicyclobacillus fastidiosus TaxID=392011 RepID=A0ABY6ZIU6_9BACL|nr:hemolysin XhlA family protein [Alicyclobacillus fastidiosus]WAH42838.1 hemolysin XhlA family protein [Alicyclobacillus fastidiosus]